MNRAGTARKELLRKSGHIASGLGIVLLTRLGVLSRAILGGVAAGFGGAVLVSYRARGTLLRRIFSINRPSEKVPGLNSFFFLLGCWTVLEMFDRRTAETAILILTFGDAAAAVARRGFGSAQTRLTRTAYLEGTVAATAAATLAAVGSVGWARALLASIAAMLMEAADCRLDDNLTIPLVAGLVLRSLPEKPAAVYEMPQASPRAA